MRDIAGKLLAAVLGVWMALVCLLACADLTLWLLETFRGLLWTL